MKRLSWFLVFGLVALCFAFESEVRIASGEESHAYIGADRCKMCHNKAEKGEQYNKWAASKHAQAFEVLASDAAKKIAADKGIGDPQKADACLKCHVTGHGAPADLLTGGKYNAEQGVTCESCHGPGGDYWKMTTMKDRDQAVAAGLVIPNESTCKGCHNDGSPTFKGFDFDSYYAKIAHPNPAK